MTDILSRSDYMLEAWLVGADFPMAKVVRRLLIAYDDRVEALDILSSPAWNAHLTRCVRDRDEVCSAPDYCREHGCQL